MVLPRPMSSARIPLSPWRRRFLHPAKPVHLVVAQSGKHSVGDHDGLGVIEVGNLLGESGDFFGNIFDFEQLLFVSEQGGIQLGKADRSFSGIEFHQLAQGFENTAKTSHRQGQPAAVREENHELLSVGHSFGDFQKSIGHQRGEDGLQLKILAVDFETGRQVEPTASFLDDFGTPGISPEDQWLVPDIRGKTDFPSSAFQGDNSFMSKTLPEKIQGEATLSCPAAKEFLPRAEDQFSQRLGRFFGSGQKIQGIEKIESFRFCSPIPMDFFLRRDDGRQLTGWRKRNGMFTIVDCRSARKNLWEPELRSRSGLR